MIIATTQLLNKLMGDDDCAHAYIQVRKYLKCRYCSKRISIKEGKELIANQQLIRYQNKWIDIRYQHWR